MKHFKEAIVYLLVGIGVGSFISLLSFTLNHATPSMKKFGLLMTMSAIMGLLSLIFEYDKITFITQLISHFILEMLTYGFFIWLTFGSAVITFGNIPTFVITYVIIFIYFRKQGSDNVRRINEQLQKNKPIKSDSTN
ncbi:DUF3021 family protein [Leuconostoc mesenteroides]|uniref:DUF3021 domain-containing protein n=1 Tax=Leuconostoc mesenteroides subsp. cremoris ATCC 19254 TaxID=586220 RepID=C2KLL1_LEUMC|nr:DUF3021 family protein [Leuconostoc mesenteroides]KDA52595.1 hypothetical protein L963_855 [Leuconostoc mesenteroides subsp. cremoris T26]EEJ41875.1 hypothetical protein HMPREF0555_1527 [Leuconostoc mesenteroides subsp. cremoris ATCC 19254]MDG9750539.1 DUF3021 family protein [Leuconostoc mesenteroides]ORI35712.1 MFS transporter [Leuconostoc mesenteroides subsp. cremoris]ORI35853.1 MFS transporter [Leuconostoc mesenteroides subsp. cremoris]